MANRLGEDAFSYYVSLGPERSYQAVAERFGVSKTTVANHATAGKWQARLEEVERRAREGSETKMVESIEEMNLRHLKMLKVVQAKALEALRSIPLNTALAAARALDASMKLERTIRGEPSERTSVNLEEVIRREYDRWLLKDGESPSWDTLEEKTDDAR
jgi:AcrR family transcriptional regulator